MRKISTVVFASLLSALSSASAQTRATSVDLFEPAIGSNNFLTVHGADTLSHKQFGLGLYLDYQHDPATLSNVTTQSGGSLMLGSDRASLVGRTFRLYLMGALGIGDWGQVGLGVPVMLNIDSSGNQVNAMGQSSGNFSTAAMGDLFLEGKFRVWRHGSGFGLALLPAVTIPTGDDEAFSGDSNVTGRIRAALSLRKNRFAAASNVGALFREKVVLARGDDGTEIGLSHQLLYGAALSYQLAGLVRPIVGMIELFGRHGFDSYLDSAPMEIDGAVRFSLPLALALTVGGGAGLVRGVGSPSVRAFAGLTWMPDYHDRDGDGVPDSSDRCPDEREDRDGFRDDDGCPELDNDGDGIPDSEDRCPNEAEDLDGVQDEDGCPDPDNDGDGIDDLHDACPNQKEDGRGKLPKDGCPEGAIDTDRDGIPDQKDRCPDEAEDKDGFQDDDGCPDPDNDRDGVPDAYDECPNAAEDLDKFQDEDGCPDPDNDHDGISDLQDKCPNEPETINGIKDEDGCPDEGAAHVSLSEDEVVVDAPLELAKPKQKNAVALLNQVALILDAHPELTKVRVQSHRQRGESQPAALARATAIKKYLTKRGVAAERLVTQALSIPGPPVRFIVEKRAQPKPASKLPRAR